MNRSALFFTIGPGIAFAYLLVKFSNLPWTALRLTSFVLTLVCFVLLAIARYQLGNSFSITPQARVLVTHGIYSRIRNPVYIFSTIAIAGIFLYIDRPIFVCILLFLIPLQIIRARKESQVLEEKFGDAYRQYKSRTWF